MYGLTNKEVIELRLKCLDPFITVASKAGIEQGVFLKKAEESWDFATKILEKEPDRKTASTQPVPKKS